MLINSIILAINILTGVSCSPNQSGSTLLEKYKQAAEYIRQDTAIQQFAQEWGKYGESGVMVADSLVCISTRFMGNDFIEWKYNVRQDDDPSRFQKLWSEEYTHWFIKEDTCQQYYLPALRELNKKHNAGLVIHFSAPDGPFIMAKVMGTYVAPGKRRSLWDDPESWIYIFYFNDENTIEEVRSALSRQ